MIIGLQGYAGAGKSTVADYLATRHGFARRHIKSPLAAMAKMLLLYSMPELTDSDIHEIMDGSEKRKPLSLLGNRSATEIQQFLGTEFGRNFIHPDLWLEIWHRWALTQPGHVVQESVRFANEAERCDVIWEIRRPGFEAHNGHVSEGLPATPDLYIENTGSVADLHYAIEVALSDLGA